MNAISAMPFGPRVGFGGGPVYSIGAQFGTNCAPSLLDWVLHVGNLAWVTINLDGSLTFAVPAGQTLTMSAILTRALNTNARTINAAFDVVPLVTPADSLAVFALIIDSAGADVLLTPLLAPLAGSIAGPTTYWCAGGMFYVSPAAAVYQAASARIDGTVASASSVAVPYPAFTPDPWTISICRPRMKDDGSGNKLRAAVTTAYGFSGPSNAFGAASMGFTQSTKAWDPTVDRVARAAVQIRNLGGGIATFRMDRFGISEEVTA